MLFPNADVAVNPALLALLGMIVGTLSGFFAVGGFLITSGLLVFGVPPIFAVGTGLTVIMGSQLINTLKYRRAGSVDFKLGGLMLVGTLPGLVLAQRINVTLEAAGLAGLVIGYIYAILLSGLGAFTIYDFWKVKRRKTRSGDEVTTVGLARKLQSLRLPPASIRVPWVGSVSTYVALPVSRVEGIAVTVPVGLGFGGGLFAGLLGAGSGFIILPLLIFALGIPTTMAVGTGMFHIFITGSIGTALYASANRVDLLMAVIMLAAASAGAQLGVAASRIVPPANVRVLYGVTLLGGSVALVLRQVSQSGPAGEFLAPVAGIVLLGVSGAMCLVIAGLLVAALKRRPAPTQAGSTGTD